MMLKRERQEFIIHQLHLHNKVLSTDLSQKMDVSEDTVRRDLIELHDAGKIIKVHGGAISKSFGYPVQQDAVYSAEQKRVIARKALSLVQDGMFIFTTGGTTILEMARCLPENLQVTFITGSLQVALEYTRHPNIEVIFIGDRISRDAQMTVGAEAVTRIRQFNADLCFLGTNAIDVQHGLTDSDWEVAQVKKAMIRSSRQVVALSISEKINTVQKIQICDLSSITTMITELSPDDLRLAPYRAACPEVL